MRCSTRSQKRHSYDMKSLVGLLLLLPALAWTQTLEIRKSGSPDISKIGPSSSYGEPAIIIRGENITLDFKNQVLANKALDTADGYKGLGIDLEGENITIKNLVLRHYRLGLLAQDAPGLKLINVRAEKLYRPRLLSTPEAEDLADWMSYHKDEDDDWLEKGAGIRLDRCDGATISNCAVNESLNGILISRSEKVRVVEGDFSMNSGVGIGMHRTTKSVIAANRVDFNVRGYSHGIYNRGQDSAGILMFEQCSNNTVAFNSVTHSGDGLFLWAGQTTMDTGEGGCNDNVFAYNDFSHAPTNGMEATFSRNKFIGNLVMENWHGLWGGFSYESEVRDNIFAYNGQAIAIEHGQKNSITGNQFFRDAEGVALWNNAKIPEDWGYAKNRDCASQSYTVSGNRFIEVSGPATSIGTSKLVSFTNNVFEKVGQITKDGGKATWTGNESVEVPEAAIKGLPAGNKWKAGTSPILAYVDKNGTDLDPMFGAWEDRRTYDKRWERPLAEFATVLASAEAKALGKQLGVKPSVPKLSTPRGRRILLVDEWGPVDPAANRIVMRPLRGAQQTLEILGATKPWSLLRQLGGPPIKAAGTAPEILRLTATPEQWAKIDFTIKAGETEIQYKNLAVALEWNVSFFGWSKSTDPRDSAAVFASKPLANVSLPQLWFGTNGSLHKDVPADYFATRATADVSQFAGEFELSVTADDGVRVFLDDKLVIDEWRYQGPTNFRKRAKLANAQVLRVEHFEIDGYTALQVRLIRK